MLKNRMNEKSLLVVATDNKQSCKRNMTLSQEFKLARKERRQNHIGRTASNSRSNDLPKGWWYTLLLMAAKIG